MALRIRHSRRGGRAGGDGKLELFAVEPALHQVASLVAEPVALPLCLHALGYHLGAAVLRERPVDLDDADREPVQVAQ